MRRALATTAIAALSLTDAATATATTPSVAWHRLTTCLRKNADISSIENDAQPGDIPQDRWAGGGLVGHGFGDLNWQFVIKNDQVAAVQVNASWAPTGYPAVVRETAAVRACFAPYHPEPIPGQTAIFNE